MGGSPTMNLNALQRRLLRDVLETYDDDLNEMT